MEASSSTQPVTVVEPQKGWKLPDFAEVWRYRDLIYFLARREIVIRYQQAVIGVLWAVIQPIFLAGVFTVFLGLLARVESPDIPYPLLAISGLVAWFGFSKTIELGTQSTVGYEPLITKQYIPRVVIPVTTMASPILDLLIGLVVVVAVGIAYGYMPGIALLALPLILIVMLVLALGFALWFSALNVKYRDFGVLVPNLLMVGLFITPIAYPFSAVDPAVQPFYALNPMVGVLEAFRWSVLGTEWPGVYVLVPLVAAPIMLVTGLLYFERAQRAFADVI